jgi:hypothetical protein
MERIAAEQLTDFRPEDAPETFLPSFRAGATQAQPSGAPLEPPAQPSAQELLALDEELVRILQEELERSRTRRGARTEQEPYGGEPISPLRRQQPQHPSAPVELDLAEFPVHPTQADVEPAAEPPTAAAPVKVLPEQGSSVEAPRRRRRIPLELVLAVVVIGVIGALVWFGVVRPPMGSKPSEAVPEAPPAPSAAPVLPVPMRSVTAIPPVEFPEAAAPAELGVQTPPRVPSPELQQPMAPPSGITSAPALPTQAAEAQPRRPIAATSPPPPQRRIAVAQPPRARPEPTVLSEVGEFMVQVYASPSPEDAQQVAEQLRRMGISGVVVVPHRIRERTWWRVRFGSYATRLEAEQAALAAGFPNAWIVRVR